MTNEPVESDDYGYDLAHEVKTALRIPVARPRTTSYRGTGRPVDPDGGDLGYDESLALESPGSRESAGQ